MNRFFMKKNLTLVFNLSIINKVEIEIKHKQFDKMNKFLIGVVTFLCLLVLRGNDIPLPPGWSLNMIEPSPDSGGCTSCKLKSSQNTLEIPYIHESGRVFLNVNLSTIPIVDNVLFNVKLGSLIPYSPTQAYRVRIRKKSKNILVTIGGVHVPFPVSVEEIGKSEIFSHIYPQYSIRRDNTCLILSDINREYLFSFVNHMQWRLAEIREKSCSSKAIRMKYNEQDQITEVVLPNDQKYVFTYSGTFPIHILDPAGAITKFTWEQGQIIAIETTLLPDHPFYSSANDALNTVRNIHIRYDEHKRIVQLDLTNSDSYTVEYRSEQKFSEKTDTTVIRSNYETDEFLRLISKNDVEKRIEKGQLFKEAGEEIFRVESKTILKKSGNVFVPVSKNIQGNEVQYVYQGKFKTEEVDSLRQISRYQYDQAGRLVKQIYPDGVQRCIFYDNYGREIEIQSETGISSKFVYKNNQVISSSYGELTTRYYYDNNGLPIRTVLPDGVIHGFEWDNLFRLTSHTKPNGVKITYIYAGLLNKIREIMITSCDGKKNYSLKYQYNPKGQLVKIEYPDATSEEFFYNCCNLVKYIDRAGAITQYIYDAKKQKILEISPNQEKTKFCYNTKNQLTKIIYPNGTTTCFEYDIYNKVKKEIDSAGVWKMYTYNTVGQTIAIENSLGSKSQYFYDKRGRLVSIKSNTELNLDYIYNEQGYLSEILNWGVPASTIARKSIFQYDKQGRIVRNIHEGSIVSAKKYLSNGRLSYEQEHNIINYYIYDDFGRVKSIVHIPVNDFFTTMKAKLDKKDIDCYNVEHFKYDKFGNLFEQKSSDNQFVRYIYTPDGELQSEIFPISDCAFVKKTYVYSYRENGVREVSVYSKLLERDDVILSEDN